MTDRVLFVCTGNICRSPTAAALLAARLAGRNDEVVVDSAGTLDLGEPSPPEVLTAAAERGMDLSSHLGRRFSSNDALEASLIVGMAREHVREVVLTEPTVFPKTFTFRELVRRGGQVGRRGRLETLGEWLVRIHEGRRHADLLGKSDDDDIEDPMGGPIAGYRATATQIADLIDELVALAWPF